MTIFARRLSAWVDAMAEHTRWILLGWVAILGTLHYFVWSGIGWPFFPQGVHLLLSDDWPHLYAAHPELQIGPLTFAIAAPLVLSLGGVAGEVAAMVLMCGAGYLVLAQIRTLQPVRNRLTDRAFLLSGICFLTVWTELAVTFAHLDDVLAILFAVTSLRALRGHRPYLAAVLLAGAVDCKPWAIAFVPLLLVLEPWVRWRAVAAWGAVVAAAWLPFFLADPASLAAGTFRIRNALASSLRVFGDNASSTPGWDRPAQLILALAAAGFLVWRRRWYRVIAMTLAVRLLLDPGVRSYYDAGLIAGCVIADIALSTTSAPLFSITALLFFYLPMFPLHALPHVYGLVRTGYLLALIAALAFGPHRASPSEALRVGRRRRPAPATPSTVGFE